jgi:hypothetical protein
MTRTRKRWIYFILILINIPLGLGSRRFAPDLPSLLATYGGDVLSASCIFFGIRFLFIKKGLPKIALISYLVCICIETLQLYQAEWIQKIRHTPPFGILLGYGFLWSDWICYAVGVLIGFLGALLIERRNSSISGG